MQRKTYTTAQKKIAVNSLKSYKPSELKRVAEETGTSVQNVRNWAKSIEHSALGKLAPKARVKETIEGSPIENFLNMSEDKLQGLINARTQLTEKRSRRDELQRQLDELDAEIQKSIKSIAKDFNQ